jgi:hypothetical protein
LVVKGSAFSVDANASLDETYKNSVVVAAIRQVFYSVNFVPNGAGANGFWPPESVTFEQLDPYVGAGNPPLYIDSVQYGRFICVTAQGAFSSSEIKGAMEATYKGSVSGTLTLDARQKEVLESSNVKIYTIGVPGYGQFQDLADPISGLQTVFTSGLSFSLRNLGAPISFTCRHIADNTLAHVGLSAEYTQPLSAQGEDVHRGFEVFDGPGGGLVDTGIEINPGDHLTISAGGAIWSGVIASGTNGPEGWPGHKPDAHAPMPTGLTAYALIAKIGNNDWYEVGRFWEGTIDAAKRPGTLVLNTNDNNPYNGDPTKKWEIVVDVKRAGAAAVGIYV